MSITSREKLPCKWDWYHIKAATRLIWPCHDVTVYQKMTNCEQESSLSCDLDIASTMALVSAVSEIWESVFCCSEVILPMGFCDSNYKSLPLWKKLLWSLPKYSSWNSWLSLFAMKWNMKTVSVLLAQITWIWKKVLTASADSYRSYLGCSLVSQHWPKKGHCRVLPIQSGHCAMNFRKGHSYSLIQPHNSFLVSEFYMEAFVIKINRRRVVTTLLLVLHREWAYHLDPSPSWL